MAFGRRKRRQKGRRGRGGYRPDILEDESISPVFSLAACLAFCTGAILMILGYARRQACKMRIIDVDAWNDENVDGNVIQWFQYMGIVLLITGLLSNCAVGACPLTMRTCCPKIGAVITDMMTGCCGKFLLLAMSLIALLCNLLGYLWLYLASLGRTPENSSAEGAINYCSPEIWYTAHIVVNLFWVVSGLVLFSICAHINYSLLSDEERQKPIHLGYYSKKKPVVEKSKETAAA